MSTYKHKDRKKVRKRSSKKFSTDEYVYVGGTKKLTNPPQLTAEIKVTISINLN